MTTQNRAEQITPAPDAGADPLQGFAPEAIIVGPGGNTLAQAAASETSAEPEAPGPSETDRLACDLATGAARDSTAVAIRTRAAWRDLNAKGNGSETYRRALSPGEQWRFVSGERLPRGTYLASDRKPASAATCSWATSSRTTTARSAMASRGGRGSPRWQDRAGHRPGRQWRRDLVDGRDPPEGRHDPRDPADRRAPHHRCPWMEMSVMSAATTTPKFLQYR
jgi:hypothetical protein